MEAADHKTSVSKTAISMLRIQHTKPNEIKHVINI